MSGTTGQLPRRHNPTNSGFGNSQKSTGTFVVEIPRKETNSDSKKSRRTALRSVLKKLRPLSSDVKVFLDPLLLYYFLSRKVDDINFDEKGDFVDYFSFNKIFGLTVCAINIFLEFADLFAFRRLRPCNGLPKNRIKRLITFCNVFLQIPSSVVLMILCLVTKTKPVFWVMLVFISLRCLKSLFQMHKWYRTSRTAAKSYAWFMLFVVFYAAFSHLLGALWYIQAIFKKENCWNEAFDKYEFKVWNTTLKRDRIVKYCSRNTNSFKFGLYSDANQSGILDRTAVIPKILYCFRWALQNLSSFGQGLQPDGTDILQNIVVIGVIFASVFLFSFTIGKVQIFLQYNIKRNEMIRKKLEEIEQWSPFQNLPKNLRFEVKNHYNKLWDATKGDNKKNILHDLPQSLREKIIPELCIDLLQKAEEFRSWSEQPSKVNRASLAELFECVKLVSYEEDTNIIQKGDSIDKAIFVLQGKLWIHTPTDATTSGSPSNASSNHRNDLLIYGNFCGQELISQIQAEPDTLNLPVSDRSIQAVTKVEAFVLRAYDLKNIFIKRQEAELARQQAADNPALSQP